MDIHYMLKSGLDKQDLKNMLDLFEESQRAIRNEAIFEAEALLEAEKEDEEDD